ncbi:MAG: hypothetical protein ABR971_09710 [Acidobacteriaceae bacterium]|jgi:hypothetical protein
MESNPPQPSFPGQAPVPKRAFFLPPAPPAELKPIPRWIWITSILGVLLLAGLLIPAIRAIHKQTAVFTAVVDSLHASMMNADDAEIFKHADPDYQQQIGQKRSGELFAYVRDRLGAPRDAKFIGSSVTANSKTGEVVTINYLTIFDKGSGTETIQLHKVNGHYLLLGYTVRSAQMPPSEIPADLKSN